MANSVLDFLHLKRLYDKG
uniref:Uncharacterized protein n=1 Tax=Arundo donax TaxID=35708 RepID=A0A0A9FHN4_ARUDO